MKVFFQQFKSLLFFLLISSIGYIYLGYQVDRGDFPSLLLFYALPFIAYFFMLNSSKKGLLMPYLGMAVIVRLLFLFSIPVLSDDYFRFIWDGHLLANGLNPFDFIPAEVKIDFPNKEILLSGMNSPNYYSVYPPVAQMLFLMSVYFSPNSLMGSVIVLRIAIILAEMGTLLILPRLLRQLKIPEEKSLIYALNPLVIVELSGNLHIEALLIFFMVLAFYFLFLHKKLLLGLAWGFAAAVKLVPLLLLPILLRKWEIRKALLTYVVVALVFLCLWIPFYNFSLFTHYMDSLNLYFQSFEFNAGLYYFIRWISSFIVDYNPIQTVGPLLSIIAFLLMLWVLLRKKREEWTSFFNALLFSLSIYYFMAIIVHPWYLCFLVFLSVFSNYRYALLWSALIVLSYFAYSQIDFQESFVLIALEYLAVIAYWIYEGKKNQWNVSIS